ncbi:hypothetical protein DAPPUDRAFT_116649 [Daphnia pulex]|uniref:C3H1-type domain-containing protein n=1 Tax=Daphnia pulex TaxID=6669 RepID=E9HQ10_DAPPU|nr:hypothetical protein DAPPUDRAFT_116649 [Daphnia pulex]|eukprot:EFX66176.1 hypothetical protein DAPPUDRAFT_116649 [Daphnia pulex]
MKIKLRNVQKHKVRLMKTAATVSDTVKVIEDRLEEMKKGKVGLHAPKPLLIPVLSVPSIDSRAKTSSSDTSERRSHPSSRSRSPSPNRDRDRTARRSRDLPSLDQAGCSGSSMVSNRRNDRSRSPLPSRRPFSRPPVVAPVLPPVVALAPAMVVPPPFDRVQCPNLEFYGYCPTGALCMYDHGYQPDLGIFPIKESLKKSVKEKCPEAEQGILELSKSYGRILQPKLKPMKGTASQRCWKKLVTLT